MPCKIVGGTKVPGNEKSWERKFLGMKGPGNESYQELSFPGNERAPERKFQGTFVPGERKFPPGNESSQERKVSGTKVPHRDYSFLGTKGLGHKKSRYPVNTLDRFWQHQDIIYDFIAEIHGTGSRSCY